MPIRHIKDAEDYRDFCLLSCAILPAEFQVVFTCGSFLENKLPDYVVHFEGASSKSHVVWFEWEE